MSVYLIKDLQKYMVQNPTDLKQVDKSIVTIEVSAPLFVIDRTIDRISQDREEPTVNELTDI